MNNFESIAVNDVAYEDGEALIFVEVYEGDGALEGVFVSVGHWG